MRKFFSKTKKKLYTKKIIISIFFCCITFFLSLFNASFAEVSTGEISNIEISNDKEHLWVSFRVENNIQGEIKEILRSGISLKFIYEIIIGSEGIIRDKTYFSESIIYQVSYDNLRDEIRVIKIDSDIRVISLKDFDEVQNIVFNNQGIKIKRKNLEIKRGETYFLKIRAVVDGLEPKVSLGLPLFKSRKITGNWNEIKFIY